MIGVGGNTRIAILLGNGKVRRSSQVLGLILLLGALLGVAGSLSAFFLIIGWKVDYMAGLFLRGHDEALVLSIEVTSIVRWSLIFMPLAVLGSVFFTALEQAGKSLIVALSRGLIFPVLGLILLPLWWGAFGIWFTVIFSESISVLVAISCYLWHKKPASCKTVLSPAVDVSLVVYN